MLETTKRGNVASVIANIEKRQSLDLCNLTERRTSEHQSQGSKENKKFGCDIVPRCKQLRVQEKECEAEKDRLALEEVKNCLLNIRREGGTSGQKVTGGDDSSPEESTIKQTWSGSMSTGLFTSGSDFSSSDYEEEELEGTKCEIESDVAGSERSKRNSITKDCNSDFHWVISSGKQSENSPPLCEAEELKERQAPLTGSVYEKERKNIESGLYYSTDRSRKPSSDYSVVDSTETSVQLRLPPQRPGSLDRKRLPKSRPERDQKCKSSILTRSPQSNRKTHAKSLGEELNLSVISENKKRDYYNKLEEWQQCLNDESDRCCQHYKNICGGHGFIGNFCSCRHYHHQQWQSPCRSTFGSCENLQEKIFRKNSFGSQRTLCEDRNLRKLLWTDSQRLLHDSNECLSPHCCQSERDKLYTWRLFGKSGPELEERLIRLENDKESLQLQVSVLTEQVDAQNEKILDLQQSLDDKKQQLTTTEDMLQREILTRSSLETQKLELMSAISEMKLQQAAVERENFELKEERKRYQNIKPPIIPRNSSPALSTPVGSSRMSPIDYSNSRKSSNTFSGQDLYQNDSTSSQPNSFSDSHHKYIISSTPNKMIGSVSGSLDHQQQQNNYFTSSPQPRSMDHYSSLPRQKILESKELNLLPETTGRVSASGKGLTSLITLKSEKSYSAPNLAETEKQPDTEQTDSIQSDSTSTSKSTVPSQIQHGTTSRKGIKKFFNKPDKPFSEWDTESLCGWLEELSLENYVADLRRWIKNGSQLLSASHSEIEKELGMKNQMHKKKLLLALQEMSEKGVECDELLKPAGCLDTAWVMRWLDDVGLPQHKEMFLTARVDGRMLHRLTMDDLATMHITSALHVASLKKGIKVLREYKMDPNYLTRRSIPNEPPPTAADVALWTNHRVMEWLRVVDLAEYAPNLRGSGVHGALMVYETKFTAELLASLLNIPPNKTLLRRHLNTHFKELLGRSVIQAKREAETTLGYIPLTPSAKVKAVKKPQFTLKRKKHKQEFDFGDLVCPLEDGASGENSFPTNACISANGGGLGGMKEKRHVPDVCPLTDPSPRDSPVITRVVRI
ncbi:hypothetical protein RUM44_006864 [Polyplax serrata]|uniref:SAM domain-containing protein n=1 Tax=Polyplax serrata TaxID=468196 RepID=A0ABR1AJD0_POLSC